MGLLMTEWLDSVDGMNARMNRTLYKGKVHGSTAARYVTCPKYPKMCRLCYEFLVGFV